ncbi:MAG: endo-1,4-beta-xylanase, partial [Lachnospiraceae bacterium]|nr:endo-1,4-beta-xylanase [Lachnospiraceae bacterium]
DNVTKSSAIADMVKKINWKWRTDQVNNPEAVSNANSYNGRLLIEGIGMQAHYDQNTSVTAVEASLRRYIETGARVSVTELDINVNNSQFGLSPAQLMGQAQKYAQLFQLYKHYADFIERVTIWAREDGKSWRPGSVIFDETFKKKLAFDAVIDPDGFLAANPASPVFTPMAIAAGWPAAQTDPGPDPDLPDIDLGPKKANAMQGTPTFGINDPLWNTAPLIIADNMIFGPGTRDIGRPDTSGNARVLWDSENLYVRVEVIDEIYDVSSSNDWEKDSVEIFLSEENFRGAYSAAQGNQYRLTAPGTGFEYGRVSAKTANALLGANWPTGATAALADNDYAISELTTNGYIVEMRIPFRGGFAAEAGKVIGFDIQINDAPPAADERTQVTWSDPLAGGYNSSMAWGEVTLVSPQGPGGQPSQGTGGGGASVEAPGPSFGNQPQAAESWNKVNNTLNVLNNNGTSANTQTNASGDGFDHVVMTGKEVVVPAQILNTLQGTSGTVMMNTGAGVTFSVSGGNIPDGYTATRIDLSLSEKGMAAPAAKIAAVKAGSVASVEVPMVSRESFGVAIGQHYNFGTDNAGKFANLYRFNDTTGEFEYLGSFEINEKGQAMFGVTRGADYLVTVTNQRPNLAVVPTLDVSSYIVRPGDSLYRIARMHDISLAQLIALNPQILRPNFIRPGERIRLV